MTRDEQEKQLQQAGRWLEQVTASHETKEITAAQWRMAGRIEDELKEAGEIPTGSDVETEFTATVDDQEQLEALLIKYAFKGDSVAFEAALKQEIMDQQAE